MENRRDRYAMGEEIRYYIGLENGFTSGELPLRPLTESKRSPESFNAGIEPLPGTVKGFRRDVPTISSDRVEIGTQSSESEGTIRSLRSEVSMDELKRETDFLSLLKRSSAVQERLREFPRSSNGDCALGDIISSIENLLLDYDESTSRQSTPGTSSQSAPGTSSEEYSERSSSSLGPRDLGSTGTKRQRTSKHTFGEVVERTAAKSFEHKQNQAARGDGKVLRCFYASFDPYAPDGGCKETRKNIRDLIVHWIAHGVFYCTECSRYFQDDGARDAFNSHLVNHEENKICIDIECVNKKDGELHHKRRNGCKDLRFGKDKNSRKWYSLFHQAFPQHSLPSWDEVEIGSSTATIAPWATNTSTNANMEGLGNASLEGWQDESVSHAASLGSSDQIVVSLREELDRAKKRIDTQDTILKQQSRVIVQQNARLDQQDNDIERLEQRLQAFEGLLHRTLGTSPAAEQASNFSKSTFTGL